MRLLGFLFAQFEKHKLIHMFDIGEALKQCKLKTFILFPIDVLFDYCYVSL